MLEKKGQGLSGVMGYWSMGKGMDREITNWNLFQGRRQASSTHYSMIPSFHYSIG
jgi:hypothetical protein